MISIELKFAIITNLIMLAFFAGIYVCTIKNHGQNIKDLKEFFSEKIRDIKDDFKEQLNRVENKQDKHNNLIERITLVESSTNSAHKRIDEIKKENRCINFQKNH